MIKFYDKTYTLEQAIDLDDNIDVNQGTNWMGRWGLDSSKKMLGRLIADETAKSRDPK